MLLSSITAFTSLCFDIFFGANKFQVGLDVVATSFALCVYFLSLRTKRYELYAIPAIVIFLTVVTMSWFMFHGLKGGTPFYFFILLVASIAILKKPYKYIGIAVIMLVVVSLLLVENFNPGLYFNMDYGQRLIDTSTSFFLCLIIVLFMTNTILSEHAKDKEKLKRAYEEIKTLKKFLPMCARCKKIRDDKGYWAQIEEYFSKHSDIEFSHGLCPECYKKTMKESNLE